MFALTTVPAHRMKLAAKLFGTTLGRKYLMALTGAGLFGFTFVHMLGNLQLFLGPESLNRYAHFLQSNKELLWPARFGLLGMVVLHIWSAVKLTAENRAARPVQYVGDPAPAAATFASRTMMMSGIIIAAFAVYHILHFTVQVPEINFVAIDFKTLHVTEGAQKGYHDVHRMMVAGFQHPLVSGFYILAVGLLCLHLSHGLSALFQSLGLRNHAWWPLIQRFGIVASLLLFLGYITVPVAVWSGWVTAAGYCACCK